jgi:ADP-heptose:LPS heptosyltransferase
MSTSMTDGPSLVRFARKPWPEQKVAMKMRLALTCRSMERLMGYRNPCDAPWRRRTVDVLRATGVGDVLMCTPALRELKRLRPDRVIRFYTDLPSLVRGLPYIDAVLPAAAAPLGVVFPDYKSATPDAAHLSRLLGNSLGVSVADIRPDCAVDAAPAARFREMWRRLPRPHIVVNRRASEWTPNKDWPAPYWRALIDRLSRRAGVVEIGAVAASAAEGFGPDYIDLRGQTSLDEVVAVIAGADLHVGPPSGPVHIAAATGKRSVVIIGGYEGPGNTAYPFDTALFTPVACAPCWLQTPCPYALKCLHAISPEAVETAALTLWHEIARGNGAVAAALS